MVNKIRSKDLIIFGLIWAVIFLIYGLFPLLQGHKIRIWSTVIAGVVVLVSLFRPCLLSGLYRIWVKAGEFVGGILSQVIMFLLYFGLFTPMALILRILGKDLLNKKLDKNTDSYWIIRETQPESMKNQF